MVHVGLTCPKMGDSTKLIWAFGPIWALESSRLWEKKPKIGEGVILTTYGKVQVGEPPEMLALAKWASLRDFDFLRDGP